MTLNRKSRLEEEIDYFHTLSTTELQAKRVEFQNIRVLINNEIEEAQLINKYHPDWLRKARAAFKIHGLKICAIDSILGDRNESKKYLRAFYTIVKENSPPSMFKLFEERTKEKLENDKNMS